MSDDIDEPLEQAVQHSMALSAQVGRELARAWRSHLEDKARRDERTAALVQRAFNNERDTAALALAPVQTPQWWDEANVPQILSAYELANTWAEHDPRAAQAEVTLREATAERYGFDPAKLLQEGHQFTEHLKAVEPERLAEAQRWARLSGWEGPPSFYPEAQKIRTLLRDFDAAAAVEARRNAQTSDVAATQALAVDGTTTNLAVAEQRGTAQTAAVALEGTAAAVGADMKPWEQEKAALSWLRENDPARAAHAETVWSRYDENGQNPEYEQLLGEVLNDWRASTATDLEAAASAEKHAGDVQAEDARQQLAAAEQDKDQAAALSRDAEQPAPSDLDQARAWALQNDPEYAATVASERDRLDRELVERWKGVGDSEKAGQAASAQADAKANEQAGTKAAVAAGASYDRASQLEADAARMRAAGAPEKAIQAKQFGESQQKFPASHAAAGGGKAVGKVKTNAVKKSQLQGKHVSQGR